METQQLPAGHSSGPAHPFDRPLVARRQGGRWEIIRARARRRRLIANVVVVATTGAVVALAALFNHLLTH